MKPEEIGRLVEDEIIERDGRRTLTCAKAFEISERHGIALREIGGYCNENDIRIRVCQLGCFE